VVKVGKLWGNARFALLSPYSKLLYLYLVSHSTITTLGVVELSRERAILDLGIVSTLSYRESIENLQKGGWVVWIEQFDTFDTFIIKEHFLSLSKSKLNLRKAIDEGKSSIWRQDLLKIYSKEDFKPPMAFTPPTPEEVSKYALDLGYVVNGKTFVEYYASNDWYNKNNKKVRSWKITLEKVWCREENKLTLVKGAPEGYEYFHITTEGGERISPEGWKKGRPTHSNYLHAELLNDEYRRCTMKSQENT